MDGDKKPMPGGQATDFSSIVRLVSASNNQGGAWRRRAAVKPKFGPRMKKLKGKFSKVGC
jgi:hypothetical protein